LAAIEALRGLKSVTESGVSYAQYAPRVLDAKVVVDRITKDGSPAAVAAVASMLYYQLASSVWNMAVAPTTATSLAQSQTVGNALLTTDCPGLAALVGNIMKGLPAKTPANMKVPLLAEMMKNREPVIWACASSKLADAEAAAK
jgi:hypothetical protein